MEIKRCQRCHKLLRADAHICSRCGGSDFSPVSHVRRDGTGARPTVRLQADQQEEQHGRELSRSYRASYSSTPPASPHRAGHYSGLHPEDQPDQSSFMPVLRPGMPASLMAEQEPEEIHIVTATTLPRTSTKRQVASPVPLLLPRPQRGSKVYQAVQVEQDEMESEHETGNVYGPVPDYATTRLPAEEQFALPRPGLRLPDRAVPILLSTSCVFFLVATSLLAFLFIHSRPATLPRHTLTPQATATAAAMQQTPLVAGPHLQLSATHVDLGADNPGTVSHKSIALTSVGGEQINWQGSSSQPWLKLSPTQGTVSKSAPVIITITSDRSNLPPQVYSGQITFTQQGSKDKPLTLLVTMAVVVNTVPTPATTSADLVVSNASVTFNGTTTQNPASQTITLQNDGGQPLDWSANVATANGVNWLLLSSTGGHLEAGAAQAITVSTYSVGLGTGSYQGTMTFSYAPGASTTVSVTLMVNAPPVPGLAVQPSTLSFSAIQGTNPAPQSFTIIDTGTAPLNWGITEDANGAAFARVSSTHATLAPGKSVTITVRPSVAGVSATVIHAVITVLDTDSGTPVKSQQVNVTITIVSQAVISVNENQMVFTHDSIITNSTQFLEITNTGSATLNWSIPTSSLPSWLSLDVTSGSLIPNGFIPVNVTCDSSQLPPGKYSATITVIDSDPGTPVAPQTITVDLTVS